MTNPVTVAFVPGFRMIDGTDLNTLVAQINAAVGGGSTPGSFTTLAATGLASLTGSANIGAAGTAGTLTVFPATTAKGSTTFTASNNTGNTVTNINTATQAAARTYTVPDTGQAAGSFAFTDNALLVTDIVQTTAPVTVNNSATYVNVTGLVVTVVPGTYKFAANLPSTVASGTGGIKYSFHYVTTVLSALQSVGLGYTASAVAVQNSISTSDVADLFTQAAVVIYVELAGTFTVTTGGTIQIQMAQNTANGSNTVALIGGSFEVNRIS